MIDIERWPDRIDAALRGCRFLRTAKVLRETGSTQDAARRFGAAAGSIVVAWRQTAGRGRLGRPWLDTGTDGVACSFVLDQAQPSRLAGMAAVAVCRAIESVAVRVTGRGTGAGGRNGTGIGIKWPNDVVAGDGAKIAGILVECVGGSAIVGVGVNVRQQGFDGAGHFARAPASLAMLGIDADRIEVIEALVIEIDRVLDEPAPRLMEEYRRLDRLVGTMARFECGGRPVEGRVLDVDLEQGIRVLVAGREQVLPASITTCAVAPRGDRPT